MDVMFDWYVMFIGWLGVVPILFYRPHRCLRGPFWWWWWWIDNYDQWHLSNLLKVPPLILWWSKDDKNDDDDDDSHKDADNSGDEYDVSEQSQVCSKFFCCEDLEKSVRWNENHSGTGSYFQFKNIKRKLNLSKYFEHFLWTCPCWNAKDEGDCVESHHFWPPNLLSILALIIKEAYENNLLPTQLNSSLNVSFSLSFFRSLYLSLSFYLYGYFFVFVFGWSYHISWKESFTHPVELFPES